MDKLKNILSLIASAAAVLGIFWSVITGMGLVISRADASTMIDLAVQQSSAQTNQAVLDEAKARRLADLQFQKVLAEQDVAELLDIPDRSPGQDFELERAKKLIDQLDAQIASLQ